MFIDQPEFILPLFPGDTITVSFQTKGPIQGPFLSDIHATHVGRFSKRWLNKRLERLEDYLPFNFDLIKNNKPATITFAVANDEIKVVGVEGQRVGGLIVPGGTSHLLILRNSVLTYPRVALHEFGHAMGLSHPDGDGFAKDYTTDDTIMSYNVTNQDAWFRKADLLRMQELWGYDPTDIDPVTGLRFYKGELQKMLLI